MRVLIACEYSGIVREAFKARGHDAWSCDLLDTEIPGQHIKGDVLEILNDGWNMMLSFPPCTYLTVAANKWMKPEYNDRFPNRKEKRLRAIEFFMALAKSSIQKICVENPIGIMSSIWRKPNQITQPYYFGDPERKATCLWLKNLSRLNGKNIVKPDIIYHKSGKTDGKLHYETMKMPSGERSKARSKTFPGIAKAMAEQWG